MKVAFWKKITGNCLSSSKGLTKQEIEFLQSLKEGDRLILWSNSKKFTENSPDFNLDRFLNKEVGDEISSV